MASPVQRRVSGRGMTTTEQATSVPRLALTLPPLARLIGVMLLFVATALVALWLATAQPWLGLVLKGGDDGLVVLAEVQRQDLEATIEGAVRITRVGVDLRAEDLIEEPDTLSSYAAVNAFRARQAELAEVLRQPRITVSVSLADGSVRDV